MKNRKKREKAKNKKIFLKKVIGVIAVTTIGVAAYSVGSELGILPSLEQGGAEASEERFHIDFDRENEVYSQKEIREDFKGLKDVKGQNRMSIKLNALCMEMPEGKEGIKDSGAQVNFSLNESKEYTVEYKVFFDGDGGEYNWSNGGTLCGISSEDYIPEKNEGYHVGVKWSSEGEIRPYICTKKGVIDKDKKIGEFTDNLWHYVRMYVKNSDKEKDNGIVKIWIDGVLGYENNDVVFEASNEAMDKADISAYHEGVSPKKQYVYIDSYKAYPENIEANKANSSGVSNDTSGGDLQKKEVNKDLSVSLKLGKNKGDAENDCSVNVYVSNNSDKKIDNWTMKINNNKVNIESVWGASMEKKGNYYIIKPEKWNKVITAGNRVGFGFKTTGKFDGILDYDIEY